MANSISNKLIPPSSNSNFPSHNTKSSSTSLLLKSLFITIPKRNSKSKHKVLSKGHYKNPQHDNNPSWSEESETDSHKQKQQTLSDIWHEIHGQNNWLNLLDPINPFLRSELIRYGEMAQACYDAFDHDPYSKYCGSCIYTRHQFLNSQDLTHIGYTVTRYLYATYNTKFPNFFKFSLWSNMWSKNANWIGYVVVSNDETSYRIGRRDITIVWRGTVTHLEWIFDLIDSLVPISTRNIPCPENSVKVDSVFLDLYTNKEGSCSYSKYSAREQVLAEVKRLVEYYSYHGENLSVTVTGHSLGSALGILSAYDIAEIGLNQVGDQHVPISVFSFSGTRVGNLRFKERLNLLGVKVLRVVNVHDNVPKVSSSFLNEKMWLVSLDLVDDFYSHVGVELLLDHMDSPFLKSDVDDVCAHNLEAHLHLLDGYHGKGRKFILANGRDPVLVNKNSDFLKDHYMVPPYWWQEKNKGMVRNKDGTWVQPERQKLEGHPEDIDRHLRQLGL